MRVDGIVLPIFHPLNLIHSVVTRRTFGVIPVILIFIIISFTRWVFIVLIMDRRPLRLLSLLMVSMIRARVSFLRIRGVIGYVCCLPLEFLLGFMLTRLHVVLILLWVS